MILSDGGATVEDLKEKDADVLHSQGVDRVLNVQK